MNNSIPLIFVLLGWYSAAQSQSPTWQYTEGPYHGTVNCFVKGPNDYLYAGTEVGVFRTPIDHDAWELVSEGLLDREIVTLTADSAGVLYAGTEEGAFRSFDEGAHWEIVNFGLGNINVHALQSAASGVILAGTDDGIYRSTDQASSWIKVITDSADAPALCLALHPSGLLFAGGSSGLLASSDDGAHWTHTQNNLVGYVYSRLVINRWGYMAALGPSPHSGEELGWFGLSKDAGASFVATTGMDAFSHLEQPSSIAVGDSNTFFIGTYYNEHDYPNNGFLRRGKFVDDPAYPFVWETQLSSIAGKLRSIFVSENLVFASGADVIRSTDSGTTYQDFMAGLTASRVLSLSDNTRQTVFAGTQFALFHRADTASSWNPRFFLYEGDLLPILCMTSNSSGLIRIGTMQNNFYARGGLWYSGDFGASWHGTGWEYLTSAITVDSRGLWFGTNYRRLQRSMGADYPSEMLYANSNLISVATADSTEVYTGSVDGTVYCSYDTGTTWTSTQLVPAGSVQSLVAASGGRVYAGTSVGFFVSSDRGSSWVQRGRGEVPSNVRVLVAKPGVGVFAGTPDGVFRSTDEGQQWEALDQGLTVKEIYSLCFGSDGWLYAGTSGGGVYRLPLETILSVQLTSFSVAQAGGGSVALQWVTTSEIDNYGFEVERRLAGAEDYVTVPNSFQGGYGTTAERHDYAFIDTTPGIGEWQYRLKQMDLGGSIHYTEALTIRITTDVEDDVLLPTAYALRQNYPNPFNPATTVEFDVPRTSRVSIMVYDLLGRDVARLVDGTKEAGRHRVVFIAETIASGIYLLRMQAEQHAETRKIVLMR